MKNVFYGLERVLTEAPSSRIGNILLITAHNSCCISSATGKLSSMFHGLAMWAVKEPRGRIKINPGNLTRSNSGNSAPSRHFWDFFPPKISDSDMRPDVRFLLTSPPPLLPTIYISEKLLVLIVFTPKGTWEIGLCCCSRCSDSNRAAAFIGTESLNKQPEHSRVHTKQRCSMVSALHRESGRLCPR